MDSIPESSSAAPAPAPPPPAVHAPEAFRFTGTGSEYFGIWIVNLLLTIVTIGIYSAWAKVRRLQYFYRHVELAGSGFDFHGSPTRILVGRILALLLIIAYQYSVRLRSLLTLVVLAAIALAMPWLLRNSLRFRLYNTSWRGTRFHFRGSVAGSYRVFLLNGFLMLITLYLMAPFMHQRLKAYQHGNSWFGRTPFSFHATATQFYVIYLVLLAALAAFGVIFVGAGLAGAFGAFVAAKSHGGHVDPRALLKALAVLYGALIFLGISVGPVFQALITNLVWNNTRLGEHRIECRLSPLRMVWISVSNLVLVVLTLGFYIPWAAVRRVRYQAESMRLVPATDLQEFVAADPEQPGAFGEEAASAFDLDISL